MKGDRRRREGGFAMLVVFLVAAFVAISLYNELPRVVMEAQRDREEMLIDRGEQYRRAIQLYFRRFGRYPPNLDALENTNNIRFLRRRYKDPLTGEEEWRLIHATALGVFPDSLVYGKPATGESSGGEAEVADNETVPLWQQRRPSDMILVPGEGLPVEEMAPGEAPQQGGPGSTIQIEIGVPGQTAVATVTTTMQAGGVEPEPAEAGLLPEPQPTGPGPGVAAPGGVGGPTVITPVPAPTQAQPVGGSNPALQLIQRLLTTPTQRGAVTVQAQAGRQQLQVGGLAGVASKRAADSIKVYNGRTRYNEWEFVYDARQDAVAMATLMRMAPVPQQTQPAAAPGGGQPGFGVGPGRGRQAAPGGEFGPGRRGGGMMGPGVGGPGRGPAPGRAGPGLEGGAPGPMIPGRMPGPLAVPPGLPQQPGIGRPR